MLFCVVLAAAVNCELGVSRTALVSAPSGVRKIAQANNSKSHIARVFSAKSKQDGKQEGQRRGQDAAKAHRGMRHERGLDLRRADVVARHDDDVVDAARDPVVAVRVAPRAVARQVVAVVAEVRVLEPARRRRAASMALSETEGPRVERQVQKRRPRRARWSRPATRAPPSSPRVR